MSAITRFVLKRPVTAILSILCLIVFGYTSVRSATLELTPEMKEVFDAWICLKPSQKQAALQMLKAMSHDND